MFYSFVSLVLYNQLPLCVVYTQLIFLFLRPISSSIGCCWVVCLAIFTQLIFDYLNNVIKYFLKLYEKNGYQVQYELTNDYACILQSETDLYNDLEILQKLIPKGKKILFQLHFRPNVIYNNSSKIINKREIIFNVVNNFCNTHENAYFYDPSVLLNTNKSLYDGDTHFNYRGHKISFNYMYDNFLQKFGV